MQIICRFRVGRWATAQCRASDSRSPGRRVGPGLRATWSSVSPHKAENEVPLGRNPAHSGSCAEERRAGNGLRRPAKLESAPRFGGFLQFAKAVLHLLL